MVEIELSDSEDSDFGQVTQSIDGVNREYWQVAYDEQPIPQGAGNHYVFFFHYLYLCKPLLTPFGQIDLPKPTPLPSHLSQLNYERP